MSFKDQVGQLLDDAGINIKSGDFKAIKEIGQRLRSDAEEKSSTKPKTYMKVDAGMSSKVAAVMQQYHSPLVDAGLSVDTLFAFAARNKDGEQTGPAIAVRGHPVKAKIKVTPLKDRAKGDGDVELILDGDNWNNIPDADQVAILDQQFTSLELVLEEDEESASAKVARDDLGRPKLRKRVSDFAAEGYWECAERHKGASQEVQFIRSVGNEAAKQGLVTE